ncbi:oxidoreductase NAD-binding domain-containing protein [Xylariales sp. PMI_506]|nr:oxidoreductase NAD-binding domain-containing protein [Xylariales sp. PMI_506]
MSHAVAAALRPIRQAPASSIIATIAAAGLGITLYSRFSTTSTAYASSGQPKKLFTGPVFTSLTLESAEDVNHNTKRLRFQLPDGTISGFPMTSAVLTFSWPKGRWTPVVRPYTPINSPDDPEALELLVKKYPGGKASTHLHSLAPGDTLFFVTRIPGFSYKANQFPAVTLIAGGAGITPIYQLASGILRDPGDRTKINLVFGVNSDADVLLKDEFDAWEKQFPGRFSATYVVSRPFEGSPYPKGYVTKELLEKVAGPATRDSKVFVCGPPAMETALVGTRTQGGVLQELGYTKAQVHKF